MRATSAGVCLALASVPSGAQVRPGAAERAKELNQQAQTPQPAGNEPNNAAAAAAANPAAQIAPVTEVPRIIQHIVVRGTQRVEPGTVLTYIGVREGDAYTPADVDTALKALTATGLFSDVNTGFDDATGTLTIRVTENPIVNQVVFEGNSKVSDKDLTKEVQIKPRAVFTRAKVQADVQRIIELYRRNGKFAAKVDPQIIQRPQNRVDLIFSITDGPTTGVSKINFVGNKIFDSDTLKGQIATEESRWWKFLASNDNYDPDRLQFDRESLRRYYINRGYADFKVLSAVAQLTPDRTSFYLTFTVDEGLRYKFGNITIDSKIRELPAAQLRPLVDPKMGDIYSQEAVQKAIDALTNAAGTRGYAFADVHPRLKRNPKTRTIDMAFEIVQGPRVYIEKINISGNTRTLDRIIRRQFRLQEGDAFNRVLIDRSRTRIRSLGFFKDVQVKNVPGSQPDRTNLTVDVTEQSTASLQVGLGYSSTTSLLGEVSYTDTNWFGRGQNLRISLQASYITKQALFSFTEPYFLGRELAAGFDIYQTQTNFDQATYQSSQTAGVLRLGFPISEYSSVSLTYQYLISDVRPYSGAPLDVQLAAGSTNGSIFGFVYSYNDLDDVRKPTSGSAFSFSQQFAGVTGNLKFLNTSANFATYTPLLDGGLIASLSGKLGYITGYNGSTVPFFERFFDGGDTFRGFALAGVGPRDIVAPNNTGALGGTVRAIGTAQMRFPSLVPESYGVGLSLFTDFGTMGRLDTLGGPRICTGAQYSGIGTCVKDNLAFRGSAGISVTWKSPFGPVQIDLGLPYAKTNYDRPQIIHFSTATGY
ncbi:MAG TPA: outer membrane protein assembly factor BamA [Rhizomicrobium sp.]|nr:outer membrane protein assembly factor BamA [Rhizomicrobium sp.]